jgi:hypothetical protein
MKGVWGVILGAVALGALTAFYHQSLPPDQASGVQWGIVLLQAVPSGALLGLATELAFRAPLGGRRALCCIVGGVLALVPPGVWAWLAVTGDPFHGISKLWATLILCAPTLAAAFLLTTGGLVSLRLARVRRKEKETE